MLLEYKLMDFMRVILSVDHIFFISQLASVQKHAAHLKYDMADSWREINLDFMIQFIKHSIQNASMYRIYWN